MKSPLQPIITRGRDATGNGWYGARRGNRKHEGVDFVGVPGQKVFACVDGRVRIGNVYAYSTKMKLVEIKNSIYKVKQMYVQPTVKNGQMVKAGDVIGTLQDVATFHGSNKMKPHCHVGVWKHGLLTDPEPLIIPCSCLNV
ncbi:M23 family metallopeptidase [Tenacibaculum mesophilum]|uniref:M23 family metallopeptidase n=1 Tax=Tenacibaculum mesophilum TaxID=104268 RepID=UPI002490BB93|nr:M23 family metallopeptidase [Tenacibaculum mesophilum]